MRMLLVGLAGLMGLLGSAPLPGSSHGTGTHLLGTINPNFTNLTKTVVNLSEGQATRANDILQYTISLANTGSDTAIQVTLSDALPSSLTYVAGSLKIVQGYNAGSLTDAAGDDAGQYVAGTSTITVQLGKGATASSGGNMTTADVSQVVQYQAKVNGTASPVANSATLSTQGIQGQSQGRPAVIYQSGNGTAPATATSNVVDQCADASNCSGATPACNTAASPKVCQGCITNSDCVSPATCSAAMCSLSTAPTITSPSNNSTVNSSVPSMNGTAMVGSLVAVRVDGVLLGSVYADSSGNWLYNVENALSSGSHTMTVSETAGNATSTSGSTSFTVALSCTSSSTCSGATSLCNTTSSSCVACMSSSDCVNGATCSASGACVVLAPPINAPASGLLTTQTPTVSGSANGIGSAVINIVVDSVVIGQAVSDCTGNLWSAASPRYSLLCSGNWSFTPTTPIPYGVHTITANMVVGSGMYTVVSPSAPLLTVTIGNCASNTDCRTPTPVCDANNLCVQCQSNPDCPTGTACASHQCYLPAPEVDTPGTGDIETTTGMTFTGTAVAGSTVSIYVDGSLYKNATASASGAWSAGVDTLALGSHTVRATAALSGISSSSSPVNTFQVTNTCLTSSNCSGAKPVCTMYMGSCVQCLASSDCPSPANCNVTTSTCYLPAPTVTYPTPSLITDNPSPTYLGTAAASTTITVYVDGASQGTTTTAANGNWTFPATHSLAMGSHSIYVVSSAGASPDVVTATSSTVTFTEGCLTDTDCLSPAKPHCLTSSGSCVVCTSTAQCPTGATCSANSCIVSSPNILVPAAGAYTDQKPTFSGTSVANANISLTLTGASSVSLGPVLADSSGTWSLTAVNALPVGNYSVTATATLTSGAITAVSPASTAVAFHVATCVSNGDCSGGTPACNTTNHTCVRCDVPSDCPSSVACTNNACVVPPPAIVVPQNNSDTNNDPAYSGTTLANANIIISVDGKSYGPVTATAQGNWLLSPNVTVSLGNHTVTATATLGSGVLAVTSAPSAVTNFTAVACISSADCSGLTLACNTASHVCVQCTSAANCASGATCVANACTIPAPNILQPANNSTTNSTPTIDGNTLPNAVVTVQVDGQTETPVTADAAGNWSYPVHASLASGQHTASAVATLGTGAQMAVSPRSATVTWNVGACATNADCTGTDKFCDTTTHVCVYCRNNGDCSGATPACAGESACVRCVQNTDCWPSGVKCVDSNCVVPPPILTSPTEDDTLLVDTPNIDGTGIATGAISLFVDNSHVGAPSVAANGNWQESLTTPLAVGSHVAFATETLGSGVLAITSADSNVLTFYVACLGDYGSGTSPACPSAQNPFCTNGTCGSCSGMASCVGHPGGTICNSATGTCGSTCAADTDCANAYWCDSQSCVPKTVNGQPLPTDPPIGGLCSQGAAARTCLSGACDANSNVCGLPNGSACINSPVCQSAICFPDGYCGLPGAAPCADANQCRAQVCSADGLCGLPSGAVCTDSNSCRSDACVNGSCSCGCESDVDCAAETFCNAATASCQHVVANGAACTRAANCSSAVCDSDGFCGTPVAGVCSLSSQCRIGTCAAGVCTNTCQSSSDCVEGQLCSVGACVTAAANGAACTTSQDCAAGVCGADNVCGGSAGQACTNPNNCRSGACSVAIDTCVQTCQNDADCLYTQYCNSQDGNCAPLLATLQPCQRANECAAYVCEQGVCGQAAGVSCASNAFCQSNTCTSACQCSPVAGAVCASGADCASGICLNGVCGGCSDNAQCPAGDVCVQGACQPNLGLYGFTGGGLGRNCSAVDWQSWGGLLSVLWLTKKRRGGMLPWVAFALVFSGQATLQAATLPQGFTLARYSPPNPGELAFWVDKPWYTAGGNFLSVGLSVDYAHDPLLLGGRNTQTGAISNAKAVISQELVGNLELAASFFDRVTFGANVPVILQESGFSAYGVAPLQRPALSDPKLSAIVRVFGSALKDLASLHAGVALWLPLTHGALATNASVRAMPKVVVSGAFLNYFLYSAFAGVMLRRSASAGNLGGDAGNEVGTETQLGGSVSLADSAKRYAVGPEFIYSTQVTSVSKIFGSYYSSLEVLLGAHFNPTGYLSTGIAVGTGIFQNPGTPNFRALASIAYTPNFNPARVTVVADSDNDGVSDSVDACPLVPGSKNDHGCPKSPKNAPIDVLDQ